MGASINIKEQGITLGLPREQAAHGKTVMLLVRNKRKNKNAQVIETLSSWVLSNWTEYPTQQQFLHRMVGVTGLWAVKKQDPVAIYWRAGFSFFFLSDIYTVLGQQECKGFKVFNTAPGEIISYTSHCALFLDMK